VAPARPPEKAPPDNHLDLIVKSTRGEWSESFAENTLVRALLERAIEHFGLNPEPSQPYRVVRESKNETLALGEHLKAYELDDGEVILIQAPRPTDG
jgi:hypothetical protein